MQRSVVIDMHGLDTSLVVVLALFVVLFLLTRPVAVRVLVRPARRVGEWVTTHWKRTEELDSEELELWLVERRRKLCADLRRVDGLLMVVEHHALVIRVALDPMHHVGAHLSEAHEPELHQTNLLTASGPSISILATPSP